jgi:hypothetical protein
MPGSRTSSSLICGCRESRSADVVARHLNVCEIFLRENESSFEHPLVPFYGGNQQNIFAADPCPVDFHFIRSSIDLVGSLKEYKTEHNREVRMINVAFDGQKLFNWQGDADAVARIDQETKKIARSFNVSPQGLWQLTLVNIDQNGRRFFTSNREAEMMIVTWGLVTMPTKNPDHPGVFGDYLGLWDFDFDIQIDPENNKQFTIEVKSGFVNGVSALS